MTNSDLIDAYLAGSDLLPSAILGLTPEQLRARPVPGKWSTLEVLCHLADSEELFADRMKRVIAEDRPALPYSDPDLQVARLACHDRDAAEELALIALVRKQMARILRAQPAEAFARVGIHSRMGEQTLEQILRKATWHLEHHVTFIREKRRALIGTGA